MHDLPITILSKQLKYSLAGDKVKTLEKAVDLLPKLSQAEEGKKKAITKLANRYDQIKQSVANQFKRMDSQNLKGESTQQIDRLTIKALDPFYQFVISNCMCEIYGPKGSGKTSLLLHLAQQYAMAHKMHKKTTRITLLNCVSGITPKRLQILQGLKQQGMQIECLQIGQIQELVKQLSKLREQFKQAQGQYNFIGIDMMTLLLMPKQKPRLFVFRIFAILNELLNKFKITCIFTNLVQHKYEMGGEELYNHASYYCQSTAESLGYKIYLERPDKSSAGRFRLINLKGKKMQAFFIISENGISNLQPLIIKQ